MFHYPAWNPIAIEWGWLRIHWYGLLYLLSFGLAWAIALYRARSWNLPWDREIITDLILSIALGVIFGGRIGYLIFYAPVLWWHDPSLVFRLWEGGMSFHGGLIGVLIALGFWCRSHQEPFGTVADFIAPIVPIGLAAGRLGNFIQGELWGRVTTVPWAMLYPHVDPFPRHPSPLYELLLEGALLGIFLWTYGYRRRPRYRISALFLVGYGCARILAECFREPDIQYGYLAGQWLTLGQVLSVPLIIGGIILWIISVRRES